MKLEQLLQEYLESTKLMQLATSVNGQPWLCNVYFVADENNNLYWTSTKKQRHSKEIHKNQNSAVTVVKDPIRKQALQITGHAFQVKSQDLKRVHDLYCKKYDIKTDSMLTETLENTEDGRAFWGFKPKKIQFWDEVNFPDSPKQSI